tara:strand:+ start:2148 stop:2621 length:474 start_codon:yes stop_codon:yes gene_type:complete
MINIAAVVEDLNISQKSFYLIKEFNKMIEDTDISTSVFFLKPSIPPVAPFFACRGSYSLGTYHGVAISTSLRETEIMLNSSNASDKYFYVWDLEWLENSLRFEQAMKIMRDDRLKIIARSECHAVAIDNFCNKKPIGIVSDWNKDQLLEVIKNEQNR